MYYDSYGAESMMSTTLGSAPLTGMFLGIMIFMIILGLISVISYWKVFNKAGKPGWATIIPIYNNIVKIQIAKLSMIYLLLLFIPIANIYAKFKINIEIAKKFGKSSGFGVGMTLVSIIFIPMLAFSDNLYEDNVSESSETTNGSDATNVINNNQPEDVNLEQNNINTIQDIPVEPTNSNIEVEQTFVNNNVSDIPVMPVDDAKETISSSESVIQDIPANNLNENLDSVSTFENNNASVFDNLVSDVQVNAEPVENINEIPVVNEPIVDSKLNNEVPNAFNSKPIDTSMNTLDEQSQVVENNIVEPVETDIPQLNSDSVINSTIPNSVGEQKKVCKVCGETMPNIVSICPKCGTDNE